MVVKMRREYIVTPCMCGETAATPASHGMPVAFAFFSTKGAP